jgi:hypothetical protein
MAVSSAAVAAPFVMKMTGTTPNVEAAVSEPEKKYAGMKSVVIYYQVSDSDGRHEHRHGHEEGCLLGEKLAAL